MDSQPVTVVSDFRHTRRFLIAFYVLAVVCGIRNVWSWAPSRLDILMSLALSVALGCWAVVDAKCRGRAIPRLTQPWFVLLAVVLVPAYVIWSRRWPGIGWLALHAALWYALCTIAMHVTGLIIFGEEWLRGLGL